MLVAYFLTLAAFLAAALIPGGRVWGVTAWRYVPREIAILALIAGVLAPFALDRLSRRRDGSRPAVLFALATTAAVALFVALRARAHYLGDGWQSLALLGSSPPYVKPDAPATGAALRALCGALGGGERAALLAYRMVSVAAGALFVAVVATFARALLPSPADRRRLVLFLLAGGWSLLFFGYVENYALFLVAVTAYTLAGARAARDGQGPWLAAALALLATCLHGAGVVLAPSLAWLVLARTRAGSMVRNWPRIAVTLGALGVLAIALRRFAATDVSLELLFVPLGRSRFTVDGYTLFSPKHLLDLANLALLLLPGTAPLAVALARTSKAPLARNGATTFLLVLAASTALAAFVLDPKLGMARDWDLFSFVGIPWALAGFLLLTREPGARGEPARRAIALATALGFLALLPRALTNASEAAGYRQFRDHLSLDHAKGRSSRIHALSHWQRLGRDDLAAREADAWDRDFPERVLVREAAEARSRGDIDEAIRRNREAIARAPTYSDPWNNLGSIDLSAGRIDAARAELSVARALNPNEPSIWMNLGTTCFAAGDLDGAERWWKRVWQRAPNGSLVNKSLARLAQRRGDDASYEMYLSRAAAAPEAPGGLLVEWGDHLAAKGQTDRARAAYVEALHRGLSDEARRTLLAAHPELESVEGNLVSGESTD